MSLFLVFWVLLFQNVGVLAFTFTGVRMEIGISIGLFLFVAFLVVVIALLIHWYCRKRRRDKVEINRISAPLNDADLQATMGQLQNTPDESTTRNSNSPETVIIERETTDHKLYTMSYEADEQVYDVPTMHSTDNTPSADDNKDYVTDTHSRNSVISIDGFVCDETDTEGFIHDDTGERPHSIEPEVDSNDRDHFLDTADSLRNHGFSPEDPDNDEIYVNDPIYDVPARRPNDKESVEHEPEPEVTSNVCDEISNADNSESESIRKSGISLVGADSESYTDDPIYDVPKIRPTEPEPEREVDSNTSKEVRDSGLSSEAGEVNARFDDSGDAEFTNRRALPEDDEGTQQEFLYHDTYKRDSGNSSESGRVDLDNSETSDIYENTLPSSATYLDMELPHVKHGNTNAQDFGGGDLDDVYTKMDSPMVKQEEEGVGEKGESQHERGLDYWELIDNSVYEEMNHNVSA